MKSESKQEENREPPKFERWWIFGFVAVWILIGITPKIADKPGEFGDMFGMVNSLFSGAALIGLIYTIRLQMHEIYLQREELKLTRNELKKSAEAQQGSAEALTLQVLISAITAQLSAHISRRETAYVNLKRVEENLKSGGLFDSPGSLAHERKQINEGITYLTNQMEGLQKRLSQYDAELLGKLLNARKAEEVAASS
ncbi:hypothetical protein [Prosthecobacter sp.]|uniref:hypothetical protein n=1 Tax=Prosthecobacter sp. TaxID=1965333 RepID=UPI00378330C4